MRTVAHLTKKIELSTKLRNNANKFDENQVPCPIFSKTFNLICQFDLSLLSTNKH